MKIAPHPAQQVVDLWQGKRHDGGSWDLDGADIAPWGWVFEPVCCFIEDHAQRRHDVIDAVIGDAALAGCISFAQSAPKVQYVRTSDRIDWLRAEIWQQVALKNRVDVEAMTCLPKCFIFRHPLLAESSEGWHIAD